MESGERWAGTGAYAAVADNTEAGPDVASDRRRGRRRALRPLRFPCVVTALSIALLFGRRDDSGASASVLRMERSAALFPISSVLESLDDAMEHSEPDMLPEDLNRLAGGLALAGRAAEAERTLAASLRRDPAQADALYLLGALWCGMGRIGDARDAVRA